MSNLDLWRMNRSPFYLLKNWDNLAKEWDGFFKDFDQTVGPQGLASKESTLTPACDVHEDDKSYVLSFDLPGFKKEDMTIELVGHSLSVSGKRSLDSALKDARYHRAERSHGEFRRVFTLPENIKGDRIEANYENGVLYLMIPKADVEKPKKVEISEGKSNFFKTLVGVKNDEESRRTALS